MIRGGPHKPAPVMNVVPKQQQQQQQQQHSLFECATHGPVTNRLDAHLARFCPECGKEMHRHYKLPINKDMRDKVFLEGDWATLPLSLPPIPQYSNYDITSIVEAMAKMQAQEQKARRRNWLWHFFFDPPTGTGPR